MRESGVFQAMPAFLQQQALLRVHVPRFPRRNTKETVVEQLNLVQQPAPPRVADPSGVGALGIKLLDIPTIGGNLPDMVVCILEIRPEFVIAARPG